jgi:hypothetical protein
VTWLRRRLCRHARVRCVHGDECLLAMTRWSGRMRRSACLDCGAWLGPLPATCTDTGAPHAPWVRAGSR